MHTLVPVVEVGFLALFAVWTVGSLLYALPAATLRRRLNRFNHGLWFADWSVFGAGREGSAIERFVLEYRDRTGEMQGEWIVALHGRPWVWHAFLWQPQRRVADRFHRLGKDIVQALHRGTDGAAFAANTGRQIARHLEATRPRAAGVVREIRITQRRSVARLGGWSRAGVPERQIEEKVVLLFSIGST